MGAVAGSPAAEDAEAEGESEKWARDARGRMADNELIVLSQAAAATSGGRGRRQARAALAESRCLVDLLRSPVAGSGQQGAAKKEELRGR